MASLGKQDVLCESFVNGEITRSAVEKRVVYQKKDGTLEVNWFGGGKRTIIQREDGTFYWRLDIRSIKATSQADILSRLKGLAHG